MQVKKKRRRRHAAPIGGVFVALACVGLVMVVVFCINLTSMVLDNSAEKARIEQMITPVAMFDPVPFEHPMDIEPQQMLLYCMWANLSSERRSTYTYTEAMELLVPASDLDVAATRLFGPDVVLQHQSFFDYGNYQTTYYYDAERNVYRVPMAAQLYVYSPRVLEIERSARDIYSVTVGYIPPSGDAWTTDFTGNLGEPEPDKTMIYLMQRSGSDYVILAVRDLVPDQQEELELPPTVEARTEEISDSEQPDDTGTTSEPEIQDEDTSDLDPDMDVSIGDENPDEDVSDSEVSEGEESSGTDEESSATNEMDEN